MLAAILADLVLRSTGRGSRGHVQPSAPVRAHRHRRVGPSPALPGKALATDRSPPTAAVDVQLPAVPDTVVTILAELAWRQHQTAGRPADQRREKP